MLVTGTMDTKLRIVKIHSAGGVCHTAIFDQPNGRDIITDYTTYMLLWDDTGGSPGPEFFRFLEHEGYTRFPYKEIALGIGGDA